MILLTLAHRGEASILIHQLELTACPDIPIDLYLGNDLALLITGEGQLRASESTSIALTYLYKKIDSVINLGIAGSLHPSAQLNQFYPIRTIYAEDQFHSYTTTLTQAKFDCISAKNRVLKESYAQKLSPFAAIVDLEAWAIGSVCKRFMVPFSCYKLISDHAGDTTNCIDIKGKIEELALKIYFFYLQSLASNKSSYIKYQNEDPLFNDSRLHFTTSQKRKWIAIKSELEQKLKTSFEQIRLNDEFNSILLQENTRPKEKVAKLLDLLEQLLKPRQFFLKKEIQKTLSPMQSIGAQFNFTPQTLETGELQLQFKIHSEKNWNTFLEQAKNFQFNKIEKIIEGDDYEI